MSRVSLWGVFLGLLVSSSGAFSADTSPEVRPSYRWTDESGTERTSHYPAIRVRAATDRRDADRQLVRALGVEHARHRFFPQMDFFRRMVTGRLADLVGEAGNEPDQKAWAAGLPLYVDRTLKEIQERFPEEYALLEAYAEGVNSFQRSQRSLVSLAMKQESWTPRDSIAIAVAFSFVQSGNLEEMLMLSTIYQKLYVEKNRSDRFVDFLDIRPLESWLPDPLRKVALEPSKPGPRSELSYPIYQCQNSVFPFNGCQNIPPGSNAWAIGRSKLHPSMGVQSLLGGDPHLVLMNPSLFFPVSLDSVSAGGSYFVRGFTVPGIPAVVIGENRDIAWSINNRQGHNDQIFIEELNPEGTKVKFKDQWVDLDIRKIPRKVGNRTEDMTVRIVPHHGPIFSDLWPGLTGLKPGTALSYQWSCGTRSLEFVGILKVNRAQNWDEFSEGTEYFCGVGGYFIYADRRGNIGFREQSSGAPKRPWASVQNLPYLPVSGSGEFEWQGYFEKFPEIYNPASGYIAVTNDDFEGKNLEPHLSNFEDYVSFRRTEGLRSKRIRDLIEGADGGVDLKKAKEIQFDHVDLLAQHFIQDLLRAADAEGKISQSPVGQRLLHWDFDMSPQTKDGVLWISWLHALMSDHFADLIPLELLPQMELQTYGIQTLYHQLVAERDGDPEAFKKRMLRTLETTQTALQANGNIDRAWGDVHTLVLLSPLDKLWEKVRYPLVPKGIRRGGAFTTVDVGAFVDNAPKDGSIPKEFPNNYGAVFRLLSPMGDKVNRKSLAILPRGAGSPLDRVGIDSSWELQKYADGQYGPLVPWIE